MIATPPITKIDTTTVKQSVDLRELAGRYTTLHRESARESAGPCPKCGGEKRFHVKRDGFFCRDCRPCQEYGWGDAIEFVRWVEGVGFKEAVNKLMGSVAHEPIRAHRLPHTKPQAQQTPAWIEKAARLTATAYERLFTPAGQAGRDYLLSRGLEPQTWQRFKLGFRTDAPLPGTWDSDAKQFVHPPQPALVIPWHDQAGQLKAIRYRFLTSHEYTDANGRPRREKQCAAYGSQFAGQLYGWPGLLGGCEQWMTLLICEGELNALSCWQMQHDAHLDVLSLGSESQRLTPDMTVWAQQYQRVIVWTDKNDIAWQLTQQIAGAHGCKSPNGHDANDLLQAGQLGAHLAGIRYDAATTDHEREGLLWDLCDAASLPTGVDNGTGEAMLYIAQQLDRQVVLQFTDDGRALGNW